MCTEPTIASSTDVSVNGSSEDFSATPNWDEIDCIGSRGTICIHLARFDHRADFAARLIDEEYGDVVVSLPFGGIIWPVGPHLQA